MLGCLAYRSSETLGQLGGGSWAGGPANNAHARELPSSAIFENGWACGIQKATK